jgi:hypothetical protein
MYVFLLGFFLLPISGIFVISGLHIKNKELNTYILIICELSLVINEPFHYLSYSRKPPV